eukprot:CAMPEP_0113308284 /NCGR_PEP_ID=MMETSP0010_2-20120614/6784_1 /TAXON_ID=216773 ORGANISM="Corethron hystrix, Strain 308" /NCGR_SAMPLE_ID=MMETSP0010_2 /ASSEMBLY_ACC=CAM_ASM_000155 /LENGTH=307 /DNA_ID=CAMNT_0000163295 /DNA_START=412 /DNA_END=1331 /DNA_ORIENTATION=+ /assembly_acc=CAM_ASM_000155
MQSRHPVVLSHLSGEEGRPSDPEDGPLRLLVRLVRVEGVEPLDVLRRQPQRPEVEVGPLLLLQLRRQDGQVHEILPGDSLRQVPQRHPRVADEGPPVPPHAVQLARGEDDLPLPGLLQKVGRAVRLVVGGEAAQDEEGAEGLRVVLELHVVVGLEVSGLQGLPEAAYPGDAGGVGLQDDHGRVTAADYGQGVQDDLEGLEVLGIYHVGDAGGQHGDLRTGGEGVHEGDVGGNAVHLVIPTDMPQPLNLVPRAPGLPPRAREEIRRHYPQTRPPRLPPRGRLLSQPHLPLQRPARLHVLLTAVQSGRT